MKTTKKLLAPMLALSILSATPAIAANVEKPFHDPGLIQIAKVDQRYVTAAQKAVEQYGNGKSFQLEEALKDEYFADDHTKKVHWIIQSKTRDAIVTVDADSNKVLTVSVKFELAEMTGEYAKYLPMAEAAVRQLYGNADVKFEKASFFRDETLGTNDFHFSTNDRQFVRVDAVKNEATAAFLQYKLADVDPKAVSTAEQAVGLLSKADDQPFTDAEFQRDDEREVWELKRLVTGNDKALGMDEDGKQRVASATIGAKTGKVYRVEFLKALGDKTKKSLTKEQATAIVQAAVQQIYGTDLTGYTLTVDDDWGDYKFSSEGKDTIVANFTRGGQLYRLSLNTEFGKQN